MSGIPTTIDQLTEPQRACLRLVATHHNSKEIAHLLGVSPSAVDKRIERAVQILGVRSRFAAARALAALEGMPIPEPLAEPETEPVPAPGTYDRLPCDPIDLPPAVDSPPRLVQDEPWWLVRRLFGLSSPGHRIGGRTRNDLTVLQRLGLIMAVTVFVAVSSVAVLNMAVTLSGIVKEHSARRR